MSPEHSPTSIDELLDRAVRACNRGDRAAANSLAEQVLAVDHHNADAEDLLTAAADQGEIRRLTLMFIDLVDSTLLSTRIEPETYHTVVGRYRAEVKRLVNHYEGHISSTKGDGLLAVFGHPKAHEDDTRRAVATGLEITQVVARLSEQAKRRFGVGIDVRVGVHRGIVYLDTDQDDVYGFAANFAARISSLAMPGSVAVSDVVAALVNDTFELTVRPPAAVKGVAGLVGHHLVLAEHLQAVLTKPAPLVGRHRELAWLQHAWQQVLNGDSERPGVAFIGEAGIGKTRLAHAAAALAQDSAGTVIELRGSPLHTDAGLYPVRRLLEGRCGITRLTGAADRLRLLEAELRSRAMDPTTYVPLLAPVLGVGPEHGYQPAAAEGRSLYESIGSASRRYLLGCLDGNAGLIIAEDLQWFDSSTISLIESLFSAADGRLLMVLTTREQKGLQTGWPVEVFELKPLTVEESDALIEAIDPELTSAQRSAVRRRSEGIPFYIEHVLAALEASGHDPVPEALYEPLFARLHTRSGAVPVVEAAAVIGRSGDLALLRAVVGEDRDAELVVAELVEAQVFETDGIDRWRFRHELLREVAAELAPPSMQRALHERVAEELVRAASGVQPDWHLVARHYECAHNFGEAVAAYRKASVDARRRGAAEEACTYLTNALSQLMRCPPGPTRDKTEIAVRLERGFLIGAAHGSMSGDCPADYQRCLDLATTRSYQDELFWALNALVSYCIPRAELQRGRELLDSLSGLITKERPWLHTAIASSMGSIAWLQGDFAIARSHLLSALEDSSAADPRELDTTWWGNTDPISGAHTYLALSDLLHADLAGAESHLAESVRRCGLLEFPVDAFNRAHTYFKQIWVCLESGQIEEAMTLSAGMRRCTEESGLDLWRVVSATVYATVKAITALQSGADPVALMAAADNIARRVDGSRVMHLNVYLNFHDAIIGRLLIAAGQPDLARERLEQSLLIAGGTGMHFHDAELMRLRAHTFDEEPARRTALADALACARGQQALLFELRCHLDSFTLLTEGDSDGLAAAVHRLPQDARFPERQLAEQLLS
ncbi:adenylyl cyclase [Mycobacterium sp. GA-1841]|uniref:ATP-binding protein n=1 Tax=Mycobacterium sp. GA-1841 TaxID=1834154 RepID=UPI00096D7D90|nr:adenylate/guanylate cyclase domain-containing protein [Mycobacterium sp. GA-1841]OMC27828.1 adenylyl cyclase [Mycobacterium sp. GA-1841]